MKSYSIARRLIVMVLLVELLSAICVTGVALVYERHAHFRAFDIMLRGRADSVFGAVQDAEDPDDNVMLDKGDFEVPAEDVYEVRDEKNHVVGRSQNWSGADPALVVSGHKPNRDQTVKLDINGMRYRGIVVHGLRLIDPGDKGGGIPRHVTVLYASPTRRVWRAVMGAVRFYALASLVLMAVTGVAMAWLLHRGLAPLRALAAEAAKVSASSWRFEPPEEVRATLELAPLTQAIENALQRLEESFAQQRRFTGDAAHELKTAVAVVKSSLQLLSMKPRAVEQYRAGLEKCQADCERMEEIVGKMLTLARFENVDGRPSRIALSADLGQCIIQVEEQFRSMAELRGVRVLLDLQDSPIALSSEEATLLISNLLLNGLQHSGRGTQIDISVHRNGGWVDLVISDQGQGIDSAALPHVFERFYRGDPSRNRNTGGTGLGLSICKAIVDAARGEIRLSSEQGAGTSVRVRLPVSESVSSILSEGYVSSAILPSA
jgi:signal transduction histidine kinase